MGIAPSLTIQTVIVGIVVFTFSMPLNAKQGNTITPSHVYQQTEKMISEITLIRQAKNVSDTPRDPGVQVNKVPLHVFFKCVEVMEKVGRAEKKLDMTPVERPTMPLKKVKPSEVFGCTEQVLVELGKIKTKLGIIKQIQEPPALTGKIPSDVYENMWRVSYMMDGLAGQINPSNVFRNTQYILQELKLVADKYGVTLATNAPASITGKNPKDVNLEGYKNLNMVSRIERKLKMKRLIVPSFPPGNIRPSDVFDTTNMIMAELTRIKVQLDIHQYHTTIPVSEGKKPPDVLAQMQLIHTNLKKIISAI